jgi:lysophospholipase L1-like esterase
VSSQRRFERYVAIGDSSTEGIDDADGRGGYRGWANRLAEHLARRQGALLYANLGVRGKRTRQILDEQLAAALAMRPDLATLFCGTNDVVARRFDASTVAQDVATMQRGLIDQGATVLSFTLPDLTPVMPLARGLAPRVAALNAALRQASDRSGAILVDFASHAVSSDARLWSADRLHANSRGHQRIAAALGHALGLAGLGPEWMEPLPELPRPTTGQRLAAEFAWIARYLLPWIARHALGRSSGDRRGPKRPALMPVAPDPTSAAAQGVANRPFPRPRRTGVRDPKTRPGR